MDTAFTIKNFRVEYRPTPLDIETQAPRFSWQLAGEVRGLQQAACRIQVFRDRETVWDSGKMDTSESRGIPYQGSPLLACTRYRVRTDVWDRDGREAHAETFFETGLMDGSMKAWDGAEWIGPSALNLYAFTKEVFSIETELRIPEGSACGGLVFGANDPRLLDADKNLYGLAGKNYIAYELDVSSLPAKLKIYRVGYAPGDRADVPFFQREIEGITEENRHAFHTFRVDVMDNQAQAFLDGTCIDWEADPYSHRKTGRQLNSLGRNDVIAFPLFCHVGFEAGAGSRVELKRLTLRNLRTPKALLFEELPDSPRIFRDREDVSIENNCFVTGGKAGRTIAAADPSHGSMPLLRREFQVRHGLRGARLYITARGIYEGQVNGAALSEDRFQPGAGQYDKHLGYQVYDLTDRLNPGANAMAFQLSSGWWSDSQTYTVMNHNYFGDRPSLLAKLVLDYGEKGREVLVTDTENWRCSQEGPVIYSGNFHGEVYDARKDGDFAGCGCPGYREDASWQKPAVIAAVPIPQEEQPLPWPAPNHTEPVLTAQNSAAAGIVQVLTARSMTEPRPGVFVYDMGQNMAGVPRVRLHGEKGRPITLRFGEMLYPEGDSSGLGGMLLTENLRDACCTDLYICKGNPDSEVFEPRLTFHGYRYVEVTGCACPPDPAQVQGVVLSTVTHLDGQFTCSEPLVNRLFQNVIWSQYANSISIPTDCPQRNERLGWMGDAQVFAHTASFNADMREFYRRFLRDARDLQTEEGQYPNIAPVGGGFGGIAWESAGIIVTWEVYRQYGDLEIIRENYASMKKYMQYLMGRGWPGILTDVGPLGDWLATDMETDNELIWNAIFAHDANILSEMAQAIGETEDAAYYQNLFQEIRRLWNQVFVDEEGYTRRKDGTRNDTQCSYALPLGYGVFSQENREKAAAHLAQRVRRDGHTVTCGFLGTPHLNPALCDNGYQEDAYRLILQTAYPSWLYPILQGATTIWERWNSYTVENGFGGNNSMNSFNHYSLGAVVSWIYEYVLGIRQEPGSVGYRQIAIRPLIGGFEYASGHYDSAAGRIGVSWERKGEEIHLTVELPANAEAAVYLPAGKVLAAEGQETGQADGFIRYAVVNGISKFSLKQ